MPLAQGHNVGSVYIDVKANAEQFRQGMLRAKNEAENAGRSMSNAMDKAKVSTEGLGASLRGIHTILGLIGGLAVGKALIDTADKFSLMRSRIRLVTQAGEDMYKIEEQLTMQALRNRAALEPTVALYTRLRQARKDLSDQTTQNLVDLWSKSLIISASSAQEAASSTLQFSQAMAQGVLQGQELRSVIQGNSAFAVYLAQGLGITTGKLKEMGEQGKITIDAINEAMGAVKDTIEHDFAKKAITVHQALINVETAMIRWVGMADQSGTYSQKLAEWINVVAQNFQTLANVILAVSISLGTSVLSGVVTKLVGALGMLVKQIRAATTAAAGLKAVMAFMGGPWGIALGAAVAGLTVLAQETAKTETAAQGAQRAIDGLRSAIEQTNEAILRDRAMKGLADQLDEVGEKASEVDLKIAAIREQMKKTGMAAKLEQQNVVQSAIIAAATELDRITREIEAQDKLKASRGSRSKSTTLGGAREVSDAELASMRSRQAQLQRELVGAESRLKELMNASASSFLQTGETPGLSPAAILEKQMQLELARARGKKELVTKLEDELAIMQLTAQLSEKGLTTEEARAKAIEHVVALRRALMEAEGADVLPGYLSDMEQLNRELADIEKKRGEGALNSSRAAMEAMLDYLNATDDVAGVLWKIRELQGDILSDADALDLSNMVAVIEAARIPTTMELAQQRREFVPAIPTEEYTYAGKEFEDAMSQTIANATKQGLVWGIESGEWGDVFGSILQDVVRQALYGAMDVLFDALSQIDWGMLFNGVAGGTGWGGFFGAIGGLFGGSPAGAAAGGGFVSAGRKYRVGELGSEWFVPKTDGFIIPNMERMTPMLGELKGSASVVVGAPVINIAGNADPKTVEMIRQELATWSRGLPSAIDARVSDRLKRGAY